jgi:hypothetical protein
VAGVRGLLFSEWGYSRAQESRTAAGRAARRPPPILLRGETVLHSHGARWAPRGENNTQFLTTVGLSNIARVATIIGNHLSRRDSNNVFENNNNDGRSGSRVDTAGNRGC